MNTKPVYLTAEGLKKLKAELNELVTVDRPRVAARIHEAKLDGDLSENAEYEDAKQEQSFLEGRIATLELQLRNAAVIEKSERRQRRHRLEGRHQGHEGEETLHHRRLGRGRAARRPDQQRVTGRRRPDGPKKGDKLHRAGPGRTDRVHARPHRLIGRVLG